MWRVIRLSKRRTNASGTPFYMEKDTRNVPHINTLLLGTRSLTATSIHTSRQTTGPPPPRAPNRMANGKGLYYDYPHYNISPVYTTGTMLDPFVSSCQLPVAILTTHSPFTPLRWLLYEYYCGRSRRCSSTQQDAVWALSMRDPIYGRLYMRSEAMEHQIRQTQKTVFRKSNIMLCICMSYGRMVRGVILCE